MFGLVGLVDKIFHFGYIEEMGCGKLRQIFQYEVDTGRAARVTRKTVNRLTDAMMSDDLLLGNCIKEALRLGHKVL